MKRIQALPAIFALGLVGCDTMSSPATSGSFDPLRPPGGNIGSPSLPTGTTFAAGQFVKAILDNTTFFKNRPNGLSDADKLLKRDTSMRVISTSGTYVKVELDSGEIGFVPSVMLEDPLAKPQASTARPGEYQIYPPLPATGVGEPLPIIDPSGLPPEGAIPTIIDPEAPATDLAIPPITPTTETFPTPPPAPPVEPSSVPLPPSAAEKAAASSGN